MAAVRSRVFAASVVVTFSLAEGACTVPKDGGSGNGEVIHRNPPPREPDPQPEPEPEPEPEPDPKPDPKPEPEPIDPKTTTTVRRMDDGTCQEFTSVECPPQVMCNPPPPRTVDCPPDLLPDAKVPDNVHARTDGTCWEHAKMKCPKGATCNPP